MTQLTLAISLWGFLLMFLAGFTSLNVLQGKSAIPPQFSGGEVLSSESDKAKLFA